MPSPATALLRTLACFVGVAGATAALAQDPADRAFYQDAQVANFSLAHVDGGSPEFEEFSFWADAKGGTRIDYAYGADARTVTLAPLGPNPDGRSFAARFPNGYVLDFAPDGARLRVSDRRGGYRKSFDWMYEGPVDGRGTFCTPCVEEGDAPGFVRAHFLKAAK